MGTVCPEGLKERQNWVVIRTSVGGGGGGGGRITQVILNIQVFGLVGI